MGRRNKILIGVVLIVFLCASPGAAQTTNRVDFTYDQMGNLTEIVDRNPTVPRAPSNLTAYAGTTAMLLYWTDNASDETGFLIERKTGVGGTYAQIAQVAANRTGYFDLGLMTNTTYYYRVRASGSTVNSAYSNEASATTLADPIAAPSNLTAYAGTTAMLLYWTDNASDETGFLIERKTGVGGTYAQIAQVAANRTGYFDLGLTPSTTYYYRVRASGSTGNSAYSNEASAATLADPPAAPSNLTANAGSTVMLIYWTDNASDETGFLIERKTGAGGTYAQIAQVAANLKSYFDLGVVPSTTYYYRVRATGAGGNSQYSNEVSATTLAPPPAAPSNVGAITASSTAIIVYWTDNASNEMGFLIERKTFAAGTYAQIGQVSANVTYYIDSGLTLSTTYYYRVRARGSTENSAYSNEASATTKAPPPAAPSNLTATAVYASQVNLSWTNHSSNATGFTIERKTGTSGSFTPIVRVGAYLINYADTGITASTTYYYRIMANGPGGDSAYSNEASATTSQSRDPSAPSVLTVTADGMNIMLTYTPGNAPTGYSDYRVERKTGALGAYAKIAEVMGGQSYSDPTVQPGVTYYYRMLAFDLSGGYTSYSNEVSGSQSPTAAPSGLTATADGMGFILTWIDNTTNETGFKVERKVGATGMYEVFWTGVESESRAADYMIQLGVIYYYRVRAYNLAGGYTGYSNVASATQSASSAPSGLTVMTDGMNLKLTWTDNTTFESGFEVERKEGSTGTYALTGTAEGSTSNQASFTDSEVQPGVTYFYRVRAYTDDGMGHVAHTGYSNEASGVQSTTVAPSGLTVTAVGMNLKLTWIDNTTNEYGFLVERKEGSTGTYAEYGAVDGSNTTTPSQASFTDSGVQPGVTYSYRVRGYSYKYGSSPEGYTGYSNEASGTQATTVAPSGLTVAADGMNLKLTWTDNTTNEYGFKVERKVGATGTYAEIGTVSGSNTTTPSQASYIDSTAISGMTYYYRVRAYSYSYGYPMGYTGYSNEASGVQAPGVAPSGLTVAADGMNLKLTWTDKTTNEFGFKVERKVGAAGTYEEIGTAGGSNTTTPSQASYTDAAVITGLTYYYRVRAYTNGYPIGYTGYSNEASGVQASGIAPSGLTVTTDGMNLKLTWIDNTTNEYGFWVERRQGSAGYAQYGTAGGSNTTTPCQGSYNDSTTSSGVTYYYRVRAYSQNEYGNRIGYTDYSNEASGIR